MRLILFGGVHGVGKTTLLNHLTGIFGEKLPIFDPGIYFWKHLYELGDKTIPEVEEIVISELGKMKDNQMIVCNWHYAVWTKNGYIPQLCYANLERLIQVTNPDAVTLILIRASVEEVYKRRMADTEIKKRKIDIKCIEEEACATESAIEEHFGVIRKWMEPKLIVVENTELEETRKLLVKIMGAEILNK